MIHSYLGLQQRLRNIHVDEFCHCRARQKKVANYLWSPGKDPVFRSPTVYQCVMGGENVLDLQVSNHQQGLDPGVMKLCARDLAEIDSLAMDLREIYHDPNANSLIAMDLLEVGPLAKDPHALGLCFPSLW